MIKKNFWKNKKVLITGHTGFKGAWLSIILNILGCKVYGYALNPIEKKNFFQKAKLKKFNLSHLSEQLIKLLFKAQNNKPFFHIEKSPLPMCWNAPKDWDKDYIKYEWGHLHSHNQLSDNYTETFENTCLQSARCNQHIQTSMDIDELLIYGGELSQVIHRNLESRAKLFSSQEWIDIVGQLQTLNENLTRQ